jgi:Rps23 Pro-64 3,4-dihydroxylase Tpa1-like proline 4-hydroxylase
VLEDRQAWKDGNIPKGSVAEDIAPVGGQLVVFDSVQLPHEVREIKSGTRRALAG